MGFPLCHSLCKLLLYMDRLHVSQRAFCGGFYYLCFTDGGIIFREIITRLIKVGVRINPDLSEFRKQAPNPCFKGVMALDSFLDFNEGPRLSKWSSAISGCSCFLCPAKYHVCLHSLLKPDAITVQKSSKDLFLCLRGTPTESSGQTRGSF